MKWRSTCSVVPVSIFVCLVLPGLCSANRFEDAVAGLLKLFKRYAKKSGCVLPPPLQNGKFYISSGRCRPQDSTPACQMIPGTPVPHNSVISFYCNPGFTPNTTKSVSVCLNGHWEPSLPACEVVTNLRSANQFEDAAAGYYEMIKRRENKSGCLLPPPLENGKFYLSARRCHPQDSTPACQIIPGTPVPHSSVISFYCNPGFTPNTTKSVSVCLNGHWEPSLTACEVVTDLRSANQFKDAAAGFHEMLKRPKKKSGCLLPPPLENGKFYLTSRRCHPQDSTPACQIIPGTPVPHSSVISFYCNPGFTPNTTKSVSVCLNVHWEPSLPACEVVTDLPSANQFEDAAAGFHEIFKRHENKSGCVLPPPLENGKFYLSYQKCHPQDSTPACQIIPGTPVPHNSVISFYCNPGFTPNTTKSVSVCLSGHWEPSLPACEVVPDLRSANQFEDAAAGYYEILKRRENKRGCVLPPTLENGRVYLSARRCHPQDSTPACQIIPGTPVPHSSVISFYCNPGFTPNTTKSVSVCLNGHWEPSLPACEVGESECSSNGQCPDNKSCILGKCADSCEGLCGPKTDCDVAYHRPLCACKSGYFGNPFKRCISSDPTPTMLLLTQPTQVSVLDLNLQKITSVLHYSLFTHQKPKKKLPSVAYHYGKKYVFYTGLTQIFRDEVVSRAGRLTRTGPPVVVVASGVDANSKLTVDWVHDKLYWMSHTDERVEATDLDGGNRTTLVSTGMTHNWNLNNIAVDPYAGYLFLVSSDSIHRMNLDGTNFTRLQLAGEEKRRVYVLTLQTHKRQIFYSSWDLEEGRPYISTCDYEGRNGKDIPIGDRWLEIYAVDVFRDTLFFGHISRGTADQVWSVDLASVTPAPVMVQTVNKGFLGLKVYHPDVQKESR